ncbi:uncharacterized protein A1O9_03045 [Exophiala aquamarina CBS 119918]|uniref:Origin recognition complex subunit 2 n=1 Tax=Exophiala aquamarina CBS 119918 TaxID=1182545 RepID=A0A072PN16_9EURO|nr:uncharacterized protein A1O9_03045 [Exophiala aquamarina CBS 119918]KEF61479.1 hypothetical protein A1O9_03045 [Exophiala aquamarina CBS 119918]
MGKRKNPDAFVEHTDTPSKRRRKSIDTPLTNGVRDSEAELQKSHLRGIPRKNGTTLTPIKSKSRAKARLEGEEDDDNGSPTPKPNGRTLFATPKNGKAVSETPSKSKKADRSAKRKSAQLLAQRQDEDDWDGQDSLARAILEDDDNEEEEDPDAVVRQTVEGSANQGVAIPVRTPNKRGRPKGAKNKRSPTPEGDIPPEERYFFQNRSGPPQISNNKFNSVKSLTYDEYHEHIQALSDNHERERSQLMRLHARSFPQWQFEFAQGFGLCLYGYGSKRNLVNDFAEWLYKHSRRQPRIVVVNGYTPKLNVRGIINAIASALVGEEERALRLVGQPQEMVDSLFSYMEEHPPHDQLVLMVNSIDAQSLRRSSAQTILARLAEHTLITFLATADSPTFPTLWNSSLLDQFKFVFHDCTTFAPYTAEINVVDEVHELLGRKKLRAGGKDGIGFVLKSLPENARNLYRVLLSEILAILSDGMDGCFDDDDDDKRPAKKSQREEAEEIGIEYRTLYQKASEEFICSSSMNFQFLLKEFHDHQMITSKRDTSGTELLGVPLAKEEMEAVLEELIL